MSGGRSADRRSGAARIFALLEVFEADPGPLSLSELGRRAGLPVSTTYRLWGSCTAWGALERADDGRYRLGHGSGGSARPLAGSAAAPDLRRVHPPTGRRGRARRGGQHAGRRPVDLPGHGSPVGNRSIRLARAGDEIPLFATSAGKLLLSATPRRRVAGLLAGGIPRLTERSLTSASVFAGQLEFARRKRVRGGLRGVRPPASPRCRSRSATPTSPDGADHPDPDQPSRLTPLVQPLRAGRADHPRSPRRTRFPLAGNPGFRRAGPIKTQQKISGRLTKRGHHPGPADIRGYIDTACKNGVNVMTALRGAVSGSPWTPSLPIPT